jgi:hypothetical protein
MFINPLNGRSFRVVKQYSKMNITKAHSWENVSFEMKNLNKNFNQKKNIKL